MGRGARRRLSRDRVDPGTGRAGLTRFHLVRHAAHGLLGRRLTGRMPGVGLSAEGRSQAERVAASLAGSKVAAVVSSPLERAQDTAAPIAAALGLPVITEPGLNEVDFGDWTGLDFAEIESAPAWRAWNAARSFAPSPGGETMLAAQARALDAVARLRAAYPAGELVLVSHQDVLRSILAHFLGVPLDLFQRIALDPAHRSVIALFETDVRIEAVNLPP